MSLKISLFLVFLFISACQPVEFVKAVKTDNSNLAEISISANEILINVKYNQLFSEQNIEDQTIVTPLELISSWNKNNIKKVGNENKLIINIIDASIIKSEIDNIEAKNYEEKTIFKYEVFFLVEYELYDNSNFLIANTTVQSSRSTTSQKYISLNEFEIITSQLLDEAIKDFVQESKLMLNNYMGKYLLN